MSIGSRLKEARINLGLKQEELAKLVGVTKGAIGNYESEVSSPKESILIRLMEILKIDANYVYQDYMKYTCDLNPSEKELISLFRAATPEGQSGALLLLKNSASCNPKNESAEEKVM